MTKHASTIYWVVTSFMALFFLGCATVAPVEGLVTSCTLDLAPPEHCYKIIREKLACNTRAPSGFYWETMEPTIAGEETNCRAKLRRIVPETGSSDEMTSEKDQEASAVQAPQQQSKAPPGCQYDTQCKGNRICVNGTCTDPQALVR
ncbi:MAG: hypothetical protein QNJ97_04320 [Myxococcota bacterium]|nr:hypothetical protein [Myxococcota bacterium]